MKTRAEVAIIGGGIIGCTLAVHLASAGVDVVLFEKREIAFGASGRNHGLIFYPQTSVTDPLYRRSHELYREIEPESDLKIGLDPTPRGFVILVRTEEQWAPAEAEARACAEGGVNIERLGRAELMKAEPNVSPDLIGGWFIDDGYRLDPAALTLAFALKARRAGAEINTHTDVKQIQTTNGRVTGLVTDAGTVSADVIVDAAGPWAPKLARTAGLDLAITGARGWLLLTTALPEVTNHLLESSGWHLTAGDPGPKPVTVAGYGAGEHPVAPDIGLLIQQNPSGNVLLGGSRLASLTEEAEGADVTREIARRAAEAVPLLKDVPIASVWSGVRPMSADGLPLIGWVDGIEGLFVCGGHGGQGIILGGGSTALAAQMIMRAKTFIDPTPFDPIRDSAASAT